MLVAHRSKGGGDSSKPFQRRRHTNGDGRVDAVVLVGLGNLQVIKSAKQGR